MKYFIFSILFISHFLFAKEKELNREEILKISEAMGHLIGKNLQTLGVSFNFDAIVQGMQDEARGKESPLSEEDCLTVLSELQEASQNKIAEKNLQDAEEFLAKNKQKESVISLKEGKIQYEIVQKGTSSTITSYATPLIRYKGHYLDGTVIPETEEIVDLDNAILGLKEVLVGMKANEKRIAYIHPNFGYGDRSHLHPNVLLVFEIEVIKPDASLETHNASLQEDSNEALPDKNL